MPRDELDAFDRLYLDHGLLSTWDGSVTMLAGGGVGGGTLGQLDDVHRRASESVRDGVGRASTASRASTGRPWASDVAAIERELDVAPSRPTSRRRTRSSCAAPGRSAGRRPDPSQRDRRAATAGAARSAAGAGRSSRACGPTWRARPSRAPGSSPDARVTRVLLEGGRAAGVEAEVGRRTAAALVGPRAGGRPRRGGAPDAGDPAALRARPSRRSAGTCGSIRCRSSPAGSTSRSTCGAARCRRRARSQFARAGDRAANGYVIESAPGIPGCSPSPCRGRATDAHAERDGRRRAASRRSSRSRATAARAGRR